MPRAPRSAASPAFGTPGAVLLALAILLGGGCPRPGAVDPDAGAQDAGPPSERDGGPASHAGSDGGDAGTDGGDVGTPYAVQLFRGGDGGRSPVGTPGGAPASLEPTSQLVIEISPRPADLRVRLFDANDLALESNDAVTVLDGGLRYDLQLLEPLRAGRAYLLVLDAEQGPTLRDPQGRLLEDVRLGLLVRGEPGPEAPVRPPKRPRRR